jgi:ATP-binding cassette subfamily G (WHITE) protein 2
MATIPEAWIPALIFGNLFAFFWIFLMFLTKSPVLSAAWSKLKSFLRFSRNRKKDIPTELATSSQIRQIVNDFHTRQANTAQVDELVVSSVDSEVLQEALDSVAEIPSPEIVRRQVTRTRSAVIAPVSMEWKNIGCSYRSGNSTKVVLEGVCGAVKPQQMMALMGPSGAGKSTLLDILTMRKNVGILEGEVLTNGRLRDTTFLRNSSYVPQEDNFVPTMTTLETLSFYARMVLPAKLASKEKRRRVLDVLTMVGLNGAKNTMVGGLLPGGIHFRGLSGGERRRLSIAVGVVSAPSVIFLDEPTSGLDSFAALSVMHYIKTLAQCKQHTVIASIHQPRMGIWNMFDQALILSKGRMMYSGLVKEVIPWFSRELGFTYDPLVNGVISDWVIDLVSIGFPKPKEFYGETIHSEEELISASESFLTKYKRDHCYQDDWNTLELTPVEESRTNDPSTTQHIVEVSKTPSQKISTTAAKTHTQYNSTWFGQFINLYWRSFLNITRNPADVAGRMLTFTYVGLFIGLIFYSMADGAESVITRMNLLYNAAAFFMFIPYVSMSLFTSDRQFYSADVSAKLYHPSAYYCSNVLATLPFSIANAAVFALVVYGLTGLRNDFESIIQHVLILVVESLVALQVLYFAAVVTPNQDMAFMIAIAFTAVNILLSNFFIPFDLIEFDWISWLKWVSAMGYTWNGITKIEFQNRNFTCSEGAGILIPDLQGAINEGLPNLDRGQAAVFTNVVSDPDPDCVLNTNRLLDFFDIDTPFWTTMLILLGYLGILHLLTFAGLKLLAVRDKK